MTNNLASQTKINNVNIEKVKGYLYLKQIISFKNEANKEILSGKEKALRRMRAITTKILESCVLPIIRVLTKT